MSSDVTSQDTPATHDTSATTTDTSHNPTADPFGEEETPALPPRLDSRTEASVAPSADHGSEAPAETGNEHPQVSLLRGMFPDFDTVVLQSVLESVNYDQDRAIDVLLGMSDPNYISSATHEQPQQPDLTLDEQLARQLALEDQQQQPRHASGQSWPRRGDVPYQTRQQPPGTYHHQQQQQQYVTGSERGDFQEFQETLGRMAESGKRTFSSIVTKAKAKFTELNDQYSQRQGQPSNNQASQGGYAAPAHVDRHTASQAVTQQYYGADYHDSPSAAQMPPITLHNQQSSDLRGYDVGSGARAQSPTPSAPGAPSSPLATGRISMSSPRPSSEVPRPPPTSTGSPIDAAKLGLLPKRPVSLLTPQPTAGAPMQRQDSEELEYVENPFEEGEGRH